MIAVLATLAIVFVKVLAMATVIVITIIDDKNETLVYYFLLRGFPLRFL